MPGSGTTTLNFGAFPGAVEVTADVTGQSGYVATSEVEAWVMPIATAEHSVDEHLHENLEVDAYYLADGSFRIIGRCDPFVQDVQVRINSEHAQRHRLYGNFTIGWAWN